MIFPKIDLLNFEFDLPDELIAKYPIEKRDHSKLLIYEKGAITHSRFDQIPSQLPKNALLVFNNTKVIAARLFFKRESGATIEILLDKPILPSTDPLINLNQTKACSWQCIIGNKKKWKDEETLIGQLEIKGAVISIKAIIKDRASNLVTFEWDKEISFAEIISSIGHIPLPPYLNRKDEESDQNNYQTVYAKVNGAVAAPTAGLHFTKAVLENLNQNGIKKEEITLHVGAGTFQPIKTDDISEHPMHSERIFITKENIENLMSQDGPIIPVGTTSMRTLESLYHFGCRLENEDLEYFHLEKEYAYSNRSDHSKAAAFQNILDWMELKNITSFSGETSILIVPGYDFKVCEGIITNFHQPGTTLILLIAAFIGEDWRRVYNEAKENNYRFLSYGDSSLLIP